MRKEIGQRSLVDALVSPSGRRSEGRLERILALIDWPAVEGILSGLSVSDTGRPGYPPAMMLRALLLAQWYRLSDPELEEALADRLSFRRFIGLSLQDAVPDETTLCRFRGRLTAEGLAEPVMTEISRQLEAKGVMVKCGTIIDASVVESAARRPARVNEPSATDPEANWLSHGKNKNRFGYKAHIAVDQGSGLIRKALLTPASTHDSAPADALILGDEAAVYADKAYDKKERRSALKARGVKDRIMHKGQRGHPPSFWQIRRNKLLARLRSAIERTFGTWKRCYGYTRVRYRSLARNHTQLQLLSIAFNLRRAIALTG
jgi:IS5 family transposase